MYVKTMKLFFSRRIIRILTKYTWCWQCVIYIRLVERSICVYFSRTTSNRSSLDSQYSFLLLALGREIKQRPPWSPTGTDTIKALRLWIRQENQWRWPWLDRAWQPCMDGARGHDGIPRCHWSHNWSRQHYRKGRCFLLRCCPVGNAKWEDAMARAHRTGGNKWTFNSLLCY